MRTSETTDCNRNDSIAAEQIARQLLTQSPGLFVGLDADGAAHYWDSVAFEVAVVPADAADPSDAETYTLDETPVDTLAGWCKHVRQQRGWNIGPHVSGSVVDMLAEGLR